jgi:hypothetical protein
LNRKTYTKLSAQIGMIKATDSGFKITPRTWVGR